jgi:hypothetical protein
MLRGWSDCQLLNGHRWGISLVLLILLSIGGYRCLSCLGASDEHVAEAAVAIEMMTDPPREHIFPDTTPTLLTIKASVDGKPLDSGELAVHVSAPPRSMLLSTPFPAVEGTTLLELASNLKDGKYTVEYLFPVQGVYAFDFDIVPAPNGQIVTPTMLHQSMRVHADPASIRRAWLFRAVLFSLGGIAGAWYARISRAPKTLSSNASITVAALVCGGLVVITSPFTFADHGPREVVFPKGAQVIQGDDGWALEVRPTPMQAVSGELLDLNVTLTHEGEVFSGAMDVAMHLYNLQDDQTVLRTSVLAPSGSTSQRVQLVESALHTCSITVRPVSEASGKPATHTSLTAVIGIDVVATPTPIPIKLRVMGLFLGVVGAGMVGGFLLSSGVRKLPGRVER